MNYSEGLNNTHHWMRRYDRKFRKEVADNSTIAMIMKSVLSFRWWQME